MAGVLDGTRVLDFSRFIAGPTGCALLADLGAEVIRIEGPKGEEDRSIGPASPSGQRIWFPHWGRHKQAITLSLGTEEGRALALDLVRCSDVVVHNFVPGTKQNAFLHYDSLRKINPCIIVAAVSAFGQTGPWASRSGFDGLAQAMSGVQSLTGAADGPPQKAGIPWTDVSAAYSVLSGTALALLHRGQTGRGQMVDISLLDLAVFPVISNGYVSEYRLNKVIRKRMGNQSWYTYVNTFQTRDGGYVVISPATDGQFVKMVEAMGRADLARDPRYGTNQDRFVNRDTLNGEVGTWVAERTTEEVVDRLSGAHVPCGPVLDVAEMAAHPQVQARGMLVEIGRPGDDTITAAGFPFKLSAAPANVEGMVSPRVGEHNASVYGGLLGLSEAALGGLRARGAV